MDVPATLRAAAHALSDRTELAHAAALAGLLQNRADDMERNIAIWGCAGQDVSTLVEKYYGVLDTDLPVKKSATGGEGVCVHRADAAAA
ncbi:MAG: hypothetical protein M3460_22430 [Actinomycetota bacterium]|nr:hypothetical protein [Actinomycetota bacterium]